MSLIVCGKGEGAGALEEMCLPTVAKKVALGRTPRRDEVAQIRVDALVLRSPA